MAPKKCVLSIKALNISCQRVFYQKMIQKSVKHQHVVVVVSRIITSSVVSPLNQTFVVMLVVLMVVLSRWLSLLTLEITGFDFKAIANVYSVVQRLLAKKGMCIVIIVMTVCLKDLKRTVWVKKHCGVNMVTFWIVKWLHFSSL